jgi:glycosyltransferase involved in cell wall biosynthesis
VIKNLSERLVSRYADEVTVFTTTARNMEHFWSTEEPALPAGVEEMNGVRVRRFPVFNRLGRLRMLAAHAARRLRLPFNDWLRTIYNGPIVFGMAKAIAESDADVIAATAFPHLHMYYALAGGRRAGKPVVFIGAIHAGDDWGFDRRMMYRAIRRVDAYIAYTTFERDLLIGKGIEGKKIEVVGAGVDVDAFNQDRSVARRQYGWGDEPVLAIVAKQGPHKRFDTLLAAMPQVWEEFPEARLVIAGSRTGYSSKVAEMIAALPAERRDQVTVMDDFAEEEKPALLAACDVLVMPSGHESFGIVYLEAWASGKPVIGARIGAVPAVIDEGRDGLLVEHQDPDDLAKAILVLINDPELRERMGAAGRAKLLEKYTWDSVVDRVRGIYSQLK